MFSRIHVNHIFTNEEEQSLTKSQIIEHWQDDGFVWYLVFEYVSNFSRVHLISSPHAEEALQDVETYLIEQENETYGNIHLGVDAIRELFPLLD